MSAARRLPPGHRDPSHRIASQCDVCGETDDHPKHVFGLADGSTLVKHLQCCNCTACVVQLDHAGDKRGHELAAHLIKHGDELRGHVEKALADAEGSEG